MALLPTVANAAGPRARRWDAVVVGSGTMALMAAARLGMAGHRVLIVEEAARRDAFPGLWEPFYLAGALDSGVVDACLRTLSLPLIDRRRLLPHESAYQVVAPEFRAEVGEVELAAQELETWGLLPRRDAQALYRALQAAGEAERSELLETPLVRVGRRGSRRSSVQAMHLRGMPSEASEAPAEVAHFLAAQVRTLSNLARAQPSPEARARLLGAPLSGGALFSEGPPWLLGLLRRRIESSFGEFRSPPGGFQLVTVGSQPGLALADSEDLWLGRALIVATPVTALARHLDQDPIPEFLREARTSQRRLAIHLRCPRSAIPEGMGHRVILTGGAEHGRDGASVPKHSPDPVSLSVFENPEEARGVHLVAQAVVDLEAHVPAVEEALEGRVRELLPFAGPDLIRSPVSHPAWDDDGWLEDPPTGAGWPCEIPLRVSSRPPLYRIDRAAVAGLGVEGDLLLGWRAGDAIAAEL